MVMATSVLLGACNQEAKKAEDTKPVIGRSEIKIADGRMTPEALWAMGRIGGMNVSPDGQEESSLHGSLLQCSSQQQQP